MRFLSTAVLAALTSVLAGGASLAQTPGAPETPAEPLAYESLAAPTPAPRATPRPRPLPAPATPATTAPEAAEAPMSAAALQPQALEAYLDGLVSAAMGRDNLAGVTVSVVQNGQVVLKKGYGFASLSPQRRVDPDRTLFRIGSISKTFTWILLMEEIAAGRIRQDGPINLYLPEELQVRNQGFRNPVLVANLLDHTPGFEDRVMGQLMERNFDRERSLTQYLRQERPRRVREPGLFPTYSNYGVGLAGAALANVTGQPFETLVERRITQRLGMSRTTFREPHPPRNDIPAPMPQALAADLSDGFHWTPAGGHVARPFEYLGHIAPAGSASSTAADMAQYMIMLLADGTVGEQQIFGPETARAFRTGLRPNAAGLNTWPHGFITYPLPSGRTGYGHSGGTLSFASNMVIVPELDLGVFISVNTEGGGKLAMELPGQLVSQFFEPGPSPKRAGDPALARLGDVYAGHYVGTRRAYVGLERFVGYLLAAASVSVTPDGRLLVSGLDGVRAFVPEGDPARGVFVAVDGDQRLAFETSRGKARAFVGTFNDMTFQRVGLWSQPWVLATLAALTAIAAVATLVGLAMRNHRELRQTQSQSRASLVQTIQAVLWLLAMGLFVSWLMGAGDTAQVVYGWPGARLLLASACALVAALLTLITLAGLTPLPMTTIWRGGRRLDSWNAGRKLAFTATTLIYAAFAAVLLHWGALTPWSS